VREIGAGESVSYDARFLATRASRVATVSCGHADGLRRLFSNRGVASVRGESVPILGVVTMDMVMVDVTALPHCHVGDVATFLDPVSMTPDAFASLAEMSPYELLVGLKLRMPRVYRGHPHAAPTASATR
jgi:alanine racemase